MKRDASSRYKVPQIKPLRGRWQVYMDSMDNLGLFLIHQHKICWQQPQSHRCRHLLARNQQTFAGSLCDMIVNLSQVSIMCVRWSVNVLQDPERTLSQQIQDAQLKAHQSLLDNLNTKGALLALFDLMKGVNEYIAHREKGGGVATSCLCLLPPHLPNGCAPFKFQYEVIAYRCGPLCSDAAG